MTEFNDAILNCRNKASMLRDAITHAEAEAEDAETELYPLMELRVKTEYILRILDNMYEFDETTEAIE